MLRYVIIIAALALLCRWALGKWPWDYLRGPSARDAALARARLLLGVEEGAGHQEIVAAHRRLVALVHPDRGGSNAAVHEANDARDLLLGASPGGGTRLADSPPTDDPL